MTGFREQLFDESVAILKRHLSNDAHITAEQGQTLRQAWACAKTGNILLEAVAEVVGYEDPGMIWYLLRAQGFLSTRERWYAQRLGGKTLHAWRGASKREVERDELGFSWTTDRRVAEFFARRNQDGVLIRATLSDPVWLDTAESELVTCNAWCPKIMPDSGSTLPAWDEVKPIPPNLRSALRRY